MKRKLPVPAFVRGDIFRMVAAGFSLRVRRLVAVAQPVSAGFSLRFIERTLKSAATLERALKGAATILIITGLVVFALPAFSQDAPAPSSPEAQVNQAQVQASESMKAVSEKVQGVLALPPGARPVGAPAAPAAPAGQPETPASPAAPEAAPEVTVETEVVIEAETEIASQTGASLAEETGVITIIQPTPKGEIIVSPEEQAAQDEELGDRLKQRGSFKFVDEDLRIVLRSMAKAYRFNVTLAPEVQGRVTVDFKNVAVINALDNILKDHGFGYQIAGGILRVTTLEKIKMEEEALAVRREAEAKTAEASAAKLKAEEQAEPLETRVYTLKYIDANDAMEAIKPLITKDRGKAMILKTKQFRGFEWEVKEVGGGKVEKGAEEFVRSKTLIVQDTATALKQIEIVLKSIDRRPAQILIDAKVIEVPIDQEYRLGINWTNALNQWQVGAQDLGMILTKGYSMEDANIRDNTSEAGSEWESQFLQQAGQRDEDSYTDTNTDRKINVRSQIYDRVSGDNISRVQDTYNMGDYINRVVTRSGEGLFQDQFNWRADMQDAIKESKYSSLAYDEAVDSESSRNFESYLSSISDTLGRIANASESYTATIAAADFNLMLSAMKTDSNIVQLSNPRVIVQENYAAKIHVGERFPIIKTTVGEYGVGGASVEEWKEIGVTLKVIPQVRLMESGDSAINMIIHPAVSVRKGYAPTSTGQNSPYPIINIRESDTNVTISDGDTLVIGGLISSETVDEENKIPLLGDIPILGYLFKEKHTGLHKTNLLVFITAKVVDDISLSAYEKLMLEKAPPEALQDVRYVEDEDMRSFLYKTAKEPPPPEEAAASEEKKEPGQEGEARRETKAMKRDRNR